MPFVRGPAADVDVNMKEDRSPEIKRRKAVGDIDFGGAVEVDEPDAAMDVFLSSGFSDQNARKTLSEVYSPPKVTLAANSHSSLSIQG
eukprot:324559-Heterocapsa_arctica.AAC.1